MPETRLDRILAVSTLVTAAALVVMVAANWETLSGSAAATAASEASAQPAEKLDGTNDPVPTVTTSDRAETGRRQSAVEPPATLVLTASRGPSWLEVRAGGAEGEELYFGMLESGAKTEFKRLPVWVRLGAADEVDVRLGGARIRSFPVSEVGVAEFVASSDGVAAAAP